MKKLGRIIWVACCYGVVGAAIGIVCGNLVGAIIGMICGGATEIIRFAIFFGGIVFGATLALTGVLWVD